MMPAGDNARRLMAGMLIASLPMSLLPEDARAAPGQHIRASERQVTSGPGGRILTNAGVWSSDSKWIVYDTRSDAAGDVFDGRRIEMVNVETGQVKILFEARRGAHCGVATFHPREPKVVFILGPENPTPDWQYGPSHRQGMIVNVSRPGVTDNLDARDLTAPFTPGALRGGSHVHVWDPLGQWVSFTYNDALIESDLRDIGVSVPGHAVRVKRDQAHNHDGEYFSVLVTRTVARPKPGSDEIKRACEEGWVGTNGYRRADGKWQARALAFQGHVVATNGETIPEVFIVDLPEDLTIAGEAPLDGTDSRRPCPPQGIAQRRLTFTSNRKHPGLQGPRHWLRSSPDGSRIAFLMRDDDGVVQLWSVSPNGGPPAQITRNSSSIASAFTWSSDGHWIAHVMDNSVAVTDVDSGKTTPLTARAGDDRAPLPEACVFAPDGRKIAFVRRVLLEGHEDNQVCVAFLDSKR